VAPQAPSALVAELERWGRRHDVAVIVDRRDGQRRRRDRRAGPWLSGALGAAEQRRILSDDGRRVSGRRRELVATVSPVALPRHARADRTPISFVHPLEENPRRRLDIHAKRLIVRIQGGEAHLFDELYRLCFPIVRDYLTSIFRDRHEAEDAAQEALVRAHAALSSYELGAASPRAWLLALARNLAIDRLRRRPLTPLAPDHVERLRSDQALEPYLPGWLDDAELLMLFERLPLAQQQVLLLRYLLDLSSAQIAAALDTSPDSVRQLHARGLSFLRDRLVALRREPRLRQPRLPMSELVRGTCTPRAQRLAFTRL
jgi:RNA polymerase sigma-70 factor (ECF subfamily)